MKHGFYSKSILLPGDDGEAFRQERLGLFLTYRPQTIREAQLVAAMAEWQWQLDRSSPLQAHCDEQALEPATDAAGRMAEPLAHQRLHSTMDVTLHRQRIDRAVHRNHKELIAVQKLRRLGLIEGAVKLPPGCYMERSGEIVGPVWGGVQSGTKVRPPRAATFCRRNNSLPPIRATNTEWHWMRPKWLRVAVLSVQNGTVLAGCDRNPPTLYQ